MHVAELLYSAREDWIAVCKCMIMHPSRHHDIWVWLKHLSSNSLQEVVMQNAEALVEINANQFAILIATHLQNKASEMLEKLKNPNLQYALLEALYQIVQYKEEDITLELTTEMLEKFLELMCEFQPDHVSKIL